MFKRTIINIFMFRRTIVADVVQGIIVGELLAFFTANRIIGLRLFTFLPKEPPSTA